MLLDVCVVAVSVMFWRWYVVGGVGSAEKEDRVDLQGELTSEEVVYFGVCVNACALSV